jgi:hypothetical protein
VHTSFQRANDSKVVIEIDHTDNLSGTADASAEPLRHAYSKVSTYHELSCGPMAIPAGSAVQWTFVYGPEKKVDTFVVACGTGDAILGEAPASEFSSYQAQFNDGLQSFTPSC